MDHRHRRAAGVAVAFALGAAVATAAHRGAAARPGWVKGKGFGWIWGKDDEAGALNVLGPEHVKRALALVKQGRVYDLGVLYDRSSYKFKGHNPGEIMSFRSPEGVKRMGDLPSPATNRAGSAWNSTAMFLSDNVATQIDGLSHITTGDDDHWYNGFRAADWGGDFGVRKASAASLPPVITRGVLIDVAGWKQIDALPGRTAIGPDELKGALARQKIDVRPGDAVFIRTGTLRYWGETGADHAAIARHDSAGLVLAGAKWLVEEKGAVLIGSDTSGLEGPAAPDSPTPVPVHEYLLVEQGVPIGEFHYLEELARDRVYEFAYVVTTNKIKGTVAGFALRPLAIR